MNYAETIDALRRELCPLLTDSFLTTLVRVAELICATETTDDSVVLDFVVIAHEIAGKPEPAINIPDLPRH